MGHQRGGSNVSIFGFDKNHQFDTAKITVFCYCICVFYGDTSVVVQLFYVLMLNFCAVCTSCAFSYFN